MFHLNVTRTTLPGLAAYRSSLTLDWLVAEDERQGAMVEEAPLTRCHEYAAPSPRKVGRYMLEMLRKLDGDNVVVKDFIRVLINSKIFVEVASYEAEPDLVSLLKTPEVLRTEPHSTFPKVMALVWIAVTDPENVEKNGWCSIDKISRFLKTAEPSDVVNHLKTMFIVMGKASLVVDNFVQQFTALNIMHQSRKSLLRKRNKPTHTTREVTSSTTAVSTEEATMTFPPMAVRYETLMRCGTNRISMPLFALGLSYEQDSNFIWQATNCFLASMERTRLGMGIEIREVGPQVLLTPVLCEVEISDRNENLDEACLSIRPSSTDVVKQFVHVLPYLDRGSSNAAFLAKYRATLDHLSEAADPLDRAAALYAAVLTPLVLLQNTRNSWCLLERFQRALRSYQNCRSSEKRRALDLLINFQTARQRAHEIIKALPTPVTPRTTPSVKKFLTDDRDLGYIEEIIKNFG